MFFIGIILTLGGIAVYFYFALRRLARLLHRPTERPLWRLLLLLSSVLLTLPVLTFNRTAALVPLHLFFLGVLTDFLHLFLHRLPKWRMLRSSMLLPLLGTAMLLTYGAFHIRDIRGTTYEIEAEQVTEPKRLVFLSDLHYPNAMTLERLQERCAEISALEPDVVILGGDIVDESTQKNEVAACIAVLGTIRAKEGVFYIYGNHDTSPYASRANYTPTFLRDCLEKSGITALEDTVVDLGEISLIGRLDRRFTHRASAAELIESAEPSDYCILLDHQPVEAEENASLGFDLMLSGHTHNGQIWPIGYINGLIGPKYGEYSFGEMKLIVSSGMVGWAYPIRTQGISEYVVIDLK